MNTPPLPAKPGPINRISNFLLKWLGVAGNVIGIYDAGSERGWWQVGSLSPTWRDGLLTVSFVCGLPGAFVLGGYLGLKAVESVTKHRSATALIAPSLVRAGLFYGLYTALRIELGLASLNLSGSVFLRVASGYLMAGMVVGFVAGLSVHAFLRRLEAPE